MGRAVRDPSGQRPARGFGNVDKGNPCALHRETFDQCCPDAGASAGNEDGLVFEIGNLRRRCLQNILLSHRIPLFGTQFDYLELSD